MRTSEEQTKYILEKRDEKLKAIARRRKIVFRSAISLAACFVIGVGVVFFSIALNPANSAAPSGRDDVEMAQYYVKSMSIDLPDNVRESVTEENFIDEVSYSIKLLSTPVINFTNILNVEIDEKAVGPQIFTDGVREYGGNSNIYVYKLNDLPTNISLYARIDDMSGLLFTENNHVSYSDLSGNLSVSNFKSSDEKENEILASLFECLSDSVNTPDASSSYDKQLSIEFTTSNNLNLKLAVSVSESGEALVRILPVESNVVIAYATIKANPEKAKLLIGLLN